MLSSALLAGCLLIAAPARANQAGTDGRTVLVDGKPVFPILTWSQCAPDVEDNLRIGVNLFMAGGCDPRALADGIRGRAYLLTDYANKGQEYPGLIGHHLVDEPDGNGITPDRLPRTGRVGQTGRLIVETFTAHFSPEQAPLMGGWPTYRQYASNVDMLGFDLYPLAKWCGHPTIGMGSVYDEQIDLVNLGAGKPTFQWLELNGMEGTCGANPVPAAAVRVEAFLAIAGGATALAYFTHGWPNGVWTHFYVAPDVAAAAAAVSREVQQLAPVLLAPQLSLRALKSEPVKLGARSYDGLTYVIAANSSRQPVAWSRPLPGLGEQSVAAVGEGRTLRAHDGVVSDAFEPWGVHVYSYAPQTPPAHTTYAWRVNASVRGGGVGVASSSLSGPLDAVSGVAIKTGTKFSGGKDALVRVTDTLKNGRKRRIDLRTTKVAGLSGPGPWVIGLSARVVGSENPLCRPGAPVQLLFEDGKPDRALFRGCGFMRAYTSGKPGARVDVRVVERR